jgi:hypothetical protein
MVEGEESLSGRMMMMVLLFAPPETNKKLHTTVPTFWSYPDPDF